MKPTTYTIKIHRRRRRFLRDQWAWRVDAVGTPPPVAHSRAPHDLVEFWSGALVRGIAPTANDAIAAAQSWCDTREYGRLCAEREAKAERSITYTPVLPSRPNRPQPTA